VRHGQDRHHRDRNLKTTAVGLVLLPLPSGHWHVVGVATVGVAGIRQDVALRGILLQTNVDLDS
jgi:hypothetical protein